MKKIILLAIIAGFARVTFAQTVVLNPLKKGDDLFEKYSYAEAVVYYKAALLKGEKEEYVTNQIALSFKNLNDSDSSEIWLKKTMNFPETTPINFFYLGEALMINGKYEEAKYWFEEYLKTNPGDTRTLKKLDAIANLEQFNRALFDANVRLANFNSPGLDFSPTFYKDGIVFVSSRPKNSWVQKEFNWDQSRFLDLYAADSSSVSYYSEGLNTPYHEGPLVFYNNDQSVVYTRNNYDGKKLNQNAKGITNLKLFFAQWNANKEKWDNEKPFAYNDDNYSNGSPAISEDGKTLIFSSDRPGGFGASDLYVSFMDGGSWSEPQNLGAVVNTKGRDGFPFLTDNQLFFASDGQEGLGGLDIYVVDFVDGKVMGKARNIGEPFNSNRDDFSFILRDDRGYFTSNRNKSTSDDIYQFWVKEPQYIVVQGEVFDVDSDTGIAKSDVFFKNDRGEYLYTRAKENGKYELLVPAHSAWTVNAGKYQYELSNPMNIDFSDEDTLLLDRIYLKKSGNLNQDSLNLPDATRIVDNRIKPYDETSHFVDEFVAGDTLKFDIVYFDLDKSTLRSISKAILDRAANFMIEHVDVKLILSSHTDSRASTSYNAALSKRRSNVVEKYLIEMGVNPASIGKQNLGESDLINDCGDGVECIEDQHQLNRRTEILFVKKGI